MRKITREFSFLLALWTANLIALMEFRAAFLAQVIGMILNNAAYFIFWIIFFNRFPQVQGWTLSDMFVLFGIAAAAFGISVFLFGNILSLADIITKGGLDYYLSLPRPVLLHVIASRSVPSGLGDFTYGILSFIVARQYAPDAFLRFFSGVFLAMLVFIFFMVLVNSLAFYMGSANEISAQAVNAMITFAIYPISLFEGGARFVLYILVPAAFMGTVPAELVRAPTWSLMLQLLAAVGVLAGLALWSFHRGLRRYESGSAVNVQV